MKNKLKHALVQRLYWREAIRSWRERNPERDREIKRRYFERRKLRLLAEERKQRRLEK